MSRGTTPDQETLTGTLGNIAQLAKERRFAPPSILVVGTVVGLRETLNWYETKPLFGRGIVVTRPEAQAGQMADLLDRLVMPMRETVTVILRDRSCAPAISSAAHHQGSLVDALDRQILEIF